MKIRNLPIVSTVLALTLLIVATPATAKEAKKIHFTADAVGVLTAVDADGDSSVFALTGTATEMGAVTGETFNQILKNGQQVGIFYFRDAGGDVLIFSYRIRSVGSQFEGKYKVEAGTGRFAGAKGDGDLVVAPTDVAGTVTVTVDGTLSN